MTTETDNSRSEKMLGNKNAAKGKLFYDQLRKALVQEDSLRLRKIAEKLVESAEEGEPWAIKEVIDRVDGKAHQSTSLENSDGSPLLQAIEVRFIKPSE